MKRVVLGYVLHFALFAAALAITYAPGDWVRYGVSRYVTSTAMDQTTVYFGTTGGIIRYDRVGRKWLAPLTNGNEAASNYIMRLAYDPAKNELWVVSRAGVARYNLTFEQWYPGSDFPESLEVNSWNASRFPSLLMPFRLSYHDGLIFDSRLRAYKIMTGAKDNLNDNMYVGTWGMGAGIVDVRHLQYTPLRFGPYSSNISRVIRVGDALWLGSEYGRAERALTSYDLTTGEWRYYEVGTSGDLTDARLNAAIEAAGSVWLGTPDGLLRYSGDESLYCYGDMSVLPSQNVLALAAWRTYLFVGTDDGMAIMLIAGYYDERAGKSIADAKPSLIKQSELLRGERINDLLVVDNGLYVATDRAVYRLHLDVAGQDTTKERDWVNGTGMEELDTPTGDLAAGATDICVFGKKLYFAVGHGVVAVDLVSDVARLIVDPSLSGNLGINQIYADSTNIWCATSRGLWRCRRNSGLRDDMLNFRLYTTADGLPNDNVSSLAPDNDYLWLGTAWGLVRFLWNVPGRGD